MKMQEALKMMAVGITPKGYMVHFEWKRGGMLYSDGFPDKHAGEPLIASEEEAWVLAHAFAQKTRGQCVNIYVVDDTFSPVKGYMDRKIENRIPETP